MKFLATRLTALLGLSTGLCAAQSAAPPPTDLQAAVWAASCMACHGTDGRADGVGRKLAGRSEVELLEILQAFRDGRRPATIMHQHAKGYNDDELRRIARHFAGVRP